jgi:hypothetical protein
VTTTTLNTSGFPFQANVGRRVQTNRAVYLCMPAGVAGLTLRYEVWKR